MSEIDFSLERHILTYLVACIIIEYANYCRISGVIVSHGIPAVLDQQMLLRYRCRWMLV